MAASRLFRLKAEVASAPSPVQARSASYVQVRVDTGVFHLDGLYDYMVPEKFTESAKVGIRVQVPFSNREVEGIIVARGDEPDRVGNLKFVTKILSPHTVATVESLDLINHVSKDYACNPWDVIRSAIPPRVASVDKKSQFFQTPSLGEGEPSNVGNTKGGSGRFSDQPDRSMSFFQFAPLIPSAEQVASAASKALKQGSVLIIAPDDKDVEQIVEALRSVEVAVLRLTSSMPRDERYESFLECQNQILKIVVGTRSSVFAPIDNLSTILVYKESSSDHYEIRSPGWNSRTVAMIRSELQGQNIVFLGYSPSVEVALLIDSGKVVFRPHAAEVKTISFTPDSGTLLPGRIFSEIRNALKDGPVLFLAARKGYGNALLCSHCRNIARCECGGRLHVGAKSTPPTCAHCGEIFNQWKCKFCNRNTQYLAGRGIERASEEISRAFPGYPVVFSAGDVIKENVENRPSLILSTPGAQPKVQGGYAAVVILDAMRFFSHTDLRSQERAREIIFESVSLLSKNGKALLVIDSDHPIVPAVTRWNVVTLMKRELSERREINLPPFVSSAVLLVPESEAASISSGLRRACKEGRLPDSLVIYGPTPVAKNQCKLVLHASISDSEDLYSFLLEFQKKRSISKKELVTIRVEPYSL